MIGGLAENRAAVMVGKSNKRTFTGLGVVDGVGALCEVGN